MEALEPIAENKQLIQTLMESTVDTRNGMRKKQCSTTEIIQMFPRIIDFNGEMVWFKMDNLAFILFP